MTSRLWNALNRVIIGVDDAAKHEKWIICIPRLLTHKISRMAVGLVPGTQPQNTALQSFRRRIRSDLTCSNFESHHHPHPQRESRLRPAVSWLWDAQTLRPGLIRAAGREEEPAPSACRQHASSSARATTPAKLSLNNGHVGDEEADLIAHVKTELRLIAGKAVGSLRVTPSTLTFSCGNAGKLMWSLWRKYVTQTEVLSGFGLGEAIWVKKKLHTSLCDSLSVWEFCTFPQTSQEILYNGVITQDATPVLSSALVCHVETAVVCFHFKHQSV